MAKERVWVLRDGEVSGGNKDACVWAGKAPSGWGGSCMISKSPLEGVLEAQWRGEWEQSYAGFSLVAASGFSSVVAVCGLLFAVASLVATPRLQRTGPEVMVHGLSCPTPCGIFPDHELNLCLLHH